MKHRIAERVDELLTLVLALKQELADTERATAPAPSPAVNLVHALAGEPERLGPQPVEQPYQDLVPGLAVGFRRETRPDLHLRTGDDGLEVELTEPTESGWVTLEMRGQHEALIDRREARMVLRGCSPEPLRLRCVLRCLRPDGTMQDLPGRTIQLGPEPETHTVGFTVPDEAVEGGLRGCRVLVFCPVQPFSMTLTELGLA